MVDRPDAFSSTGFKFRALLGLSSGARVLLVGPHFAGSLADFGAAFPMAVAVPKLAGMPDRIGGQFDLVCLDLFTEGNVSDALNAIGRAAQLIADGGHLIVAATHIWWPARGMQLLTGSKPVGPQLSPSSVLRALSTACFGSITRLLALPALDTMGDLVIPAALSTRRPAFGPLRERILGRLGLVATAHPHSLYVARAGAGNTQLALLDSLSRVIPGIGRGELRIVAMALRARGALIVHCTSQSLDCLVRVAIAPEVRDRVARNTACTHRLHTSAALPESLRNLIPEPLGRFEFGDAEVYVESRLGGDELWRIPKDSPAADRAIRSALAFIETLGSKSGSDVVVDAERFRELFAVSLRQLPAHFHHAGIDHTDLAALLQELERVLVGHRVRVAIGHGDYHVGNVLVDRHTGRLNGVVDWDTFLATELVGVDRAHFLISVETWRTRATTTSAAARLALGGGGDDRLAIAVALLRTVERASNFPSEFSKSAADFVAYIECAYRILTEGVVRGSDSEG